VESRVYLRFRRARERESQDFEGFCIYWKVHDDDGNGDGVFVALRHLLVSMCRCRFKT
jgi:hypothetical protein